MKKILLLTTTVLLSSASVYAACNPNLPACQCAYPKMVNGIIGCSETYCETGTKCMPDGSCCPSDNYCESSEQEKQCCSENQTCDATKGCIEKKADIETLCAKGTGEITTAKNGDKYCLHKTGMYWDEANVWCTSNGMKMPTIYELCPDWNGKVMQGNGCPNMSYDATDYEEIWSATKVPDDNVSGDEDYYYSVNNVLPNYVEMTSGDSLRYFPICH